MKSNLAIVLSACVLFAAVPGLTQATPVYTFSSAPVAPIVPNEPDWTVGFSFTANSTFNISSLGFYDDSQDGLSTAHEVAIFDTAGSKLTSVIIPNGTTAGLINQFRYANLASVFTLNQGSSYVIAGETTGLDGYNFGNPGTTIMGLTVNPEITIGGGLYAAGAGLNFPTSTYNSYLYPTVNMNVAPVPIPATLPLLGIGLVGLGALRRKAATLKMA